MQEFTRGNNDLYPLEVIGAFIETSNAMLKYQLALQELCYGSDGSKASFGELNEVAEKMINETIESNVGLLHTMLRSLPPGMGKIAVKGVAGTMNGVGYSTAEQNYFVVVTDTSGTQQQQVPFSSIYQLDLARNS